MHRSLRLSLMAVAVASLSLLAFVVPAMAQAPDSVVVAEEERRISVARKITPATIAIFDDAGQGGGSGVIVSADGLAVTNFHVVAPCGPFMKCGLPDGRLVDAVLVGLDPPGDVALIKLIGSDQPRPSDKGSEDWPVAEWANSDAVQIGDEAFVAGNPFLLAHDFQPTITHGIISGVRRYQYPSGSLLEYADCLQTDAAINPGNSGGPLYDGQGRLIGINGRASFEKRGRVNVGIGYAISANQVQRYLSHLMCGRLVDHASLQLTVRTTGSGRVVVDQISEGSDAYRRGLRYGDEIIRFADREITSANSLQNAVSTYPPGWRVPIVFRRGYDSFTAVVRLDRRHGAAQLEELVAKQLKATTPKGKESSSDKPSRATACYKARPGYVNYYFNRSMREAVLQACPQVARGAREAEAWSIRGMDNQGNPVALKLGPQRADFTSKQGRYWADPNSSLPDQKGPPGSGDFLAAISLCRGLMTGDLPAPLEAIGQTPWGSSFQLCNTLALQADGATAEFFFDRETYDLVGINYRSGEGVDSCRIEFSDFRLGKDGVWPAEWMIKHGDTPWLEFSVSQWQDDESPTNPKESEKQFAPTRERGD
ncbi:MAG: trypsin-like peptidase domain-containing protein [Planctomycetota bacterium]